MAINISRHQRKAKAAAAAIETAAYNQHQHISNIANEEKEMK